MPEIPTPVHVLQALVPLWPPLYTALEWATQQTRAYFDAEGTPIDRHLAPSLVRYQAKRHVAHLGHDAQEGSVAKMARDLRQASAWCGPQISGDVLWRPSDLRSKGDMVKVTCSCSASVGSDARP
jgi:hypothetical protein